MHFNSRRSTRLKNIIKINPTILKVIMWRVISISITYFISLLFTKNISEASSFTLVLHSLLVVCHYIFESMWEDNSSHRERVKK